MTTRPPSRRLPRHRWAAFLEVKIAVGPTAAGCYGHAAAGGGPGTDGTSGYGRARNAPAPQERAGATFPDRAHKGAGPVAEGAVEVIRRPGRHGVEARDDGPRARGADLSRISGRPTGLLGADRVGLRAEVGRADTVRDGTFQTATAGRQHGFPRHPAAHRLWPYRAAGTFSGGGEASGPAAGPAAATSPGRSAPVAGSAAAGAG